MKTTKKFQLLMLATSSLYALGSLSSCEDDHDHDEGEVITTVQLLCSDSASGNALGDFRFEDPDGPGGNNPTRLDTIRLDSGRVTLVSLRFFDASTGTVKDISAEVRNEADEHLVCFGPAGIQLAINITDTDGMYPLGLESRWKPGAAGSGSITVTLKHQYDVKNGTCDPGDTDVEVTFPVIIR